MLFNFLIWQYFFSQRTRLLWLVNLVKVAINQMCCRAVGEMVAKIFVLWGWNFLGVKVSDAIATELSTEYKNQELSSRLAMVAADTIFKRKLSRSVIACLGI